MWTIVFLALVAVAAAQTPTPCDGPSSFTGRFRRMDRERQYYVEGQIWYDAANKRLREFEDEDIGRDHEFYDKLKLYQLNIEYAVDLKTRKCNITSPRPPTWRPYGVPPDARFFGEGTIGAVGVMNEQVMVAMFGGEFDGRDPYFVTVTEPDCFPVEFGTFSNTSGFFHVEFYDVVAGITDPEAFVIPRACAP